MTRPEPLVVTPTGPTGLVARRTAVAVVRTGASPRTVPSGDAAQGGLHAFRNDSDAPADMLLLFTPGAPREEYFEQVSRLAHASEEERAAFFDKHDSYFVELGAAVTDGGSPVPVTPAVAGMSRVRGSVVSVRPRGQAAGRGARRWARSFSSFSSTSSSMGLPGAHIMVTTNSVVSSVSALPSW